MRWTKVGAEARLESSSAKVNVLWTEFWGYYINAKKMSYTNIRILLENLKMMPDLGKHKELYPDCLCRCFNAVADY